MTFDEIAAEIYTMTNRPDLVKETESAIKSATLKAHQSDFYSKDIYETGVELPEVNMVQSLDLTSLVSNFRQIKYVKVVSDSNDTEGFYLDLVKTEELIDNYKQSKLNVAYVAGRILEMRASVQFKYLLLGAYVFPLVTKEKYSSWVAHQYPYAIIYEAIRIVFITIGQIEEANGYARLAAEARAEMKAASILDVGY